MTSVVRYEPGIEPFGRAVVAIGVFDGVHVGHQTLIADAGRLALESGALSAVVTFDRDPDRVVAPNAAAPQLLELEDKVELISALQPDVVLVVPFTQGLAALSPERFLDDLLLAVFTPAAVTVGMDFRFGSRASGDLCTLERYGSAHGFEVRGHSLVTFDGEPVTSTRIRRLVAAGDVGMAAGLLGRPHRVRGEVVPGRADGRALGAPTANVRVAPYAARPAEGVYAGRAVVDGRRYPAAVSVGVPPTFPGAADAVEVHLLDFDGDLYGAVIEVEFLGRLRDQRRFGSREDLAEAIAADVAEVRRLTGEPHRHE